MISIAWTRRDFLLSAAALSALSCLTDPVQAALQLVCPSELLDRDFAALRRSQGTRVHIRTPEGAKLRATLAEVFEYRRPSTDSPYHQYSLLFVLEDDASLQQDVHHVEHPQLGSADLLLVPVLRKRADVHARQLGYEAVITHSRVA